MRIDVLDRRDCFLLQIFDMWEPSCWKPGPFCIRPLLLAILPAWCIWVDRTLPIRGRMSIGTSEGLPTRRVSQCHGRQSTAFPASRVTKASISEKLIPWRCSAKQIWDSNKANKRAIILCGRGALFKNGPVATVIRT